MNPIKQMKIEPVILNGSVVRLEPLSIDYVEGLSHVGLEPELWRWIPSPVATIDHMHDYVLKALEEQRQGVALPFVIIDQVSNQVIGCTRYVDIVMLHKRLEIGSTWLTSMYQRTKANTEAKLLLLTYAFEKMGVIRVTFKTDALNEKSRKAILRIGAVEEGVFRKHLITASGRVRDSVYFSIIDTEWPMIKMKLENMLK
ncbi:MAG: GNAT family protein [Alphaproteobacteria bacterium]|nr:GNAT family protein [Alphaproteobacteria bacterium]